MQEWVSVFDDLPIVDYRIYRVVSIDVLVMDTVGNTDKAYYDYRDELWRYANNSKIIKKNIVKWQSCKNI